ncbi:MAG: hypothetical protein J6V48_00390 [Clostridia bacterium]|nr:hypothetical protein [Clostridia bacterium]
MLEVLPIQTKAEQERLCSLTGSEYIPDALAYAAYGDGELAGTCQFRLAPDGGHILSMDRVPGHEDFQPMFVMGRAALNFIDLCGGKTAFFDCPVTDDNRLAVGAVGFRKRDDGRYAVDLEGFFDHPCASKATSGDR